MRYHVLACDFDGTLAHNGRIDEPTLAALERLLATGRKLVMVTGRELEELLALVPEIELFALVVAENGALLFQPGSKEMKPLASPPPPEFVQAVRKRKIAPVSFGHVVVAGWKPQETVFLELIRDLGLDLQVIFNKDAVMVLPAGVNKASGLRRALSELGLSMHEAVGVGDAENDLAFLEICECGAAVANSVPAVLERADICTRGDHGKGVCEVIERLIDDDLADLDPKLIRHHLLLGMDEDGREARFSAYGSNVLVAGPSGSGKSTAATTFLERLAEHHYQFCVIDPEGDYENLEGAVTLGDSRRPPTLDEVLQVLAKPQENVVVNLLGLALSDRPPFFLSLLPRLSEMRARTARPHWLLVDEAHHLLPRSWEPAPAALSRDLMRTAFVTVHADLVSPAVLSTIDVVFAVGGEPEQTVEQFVAAVGKGPASLAPLTLEKDEILWWSRHTRRGRRIKLVPHRTARRRHSRKYAEGELPPERSFFFRGPHRKLNLRAQNLILFMQLADGIDDETWLHHLRQHDYSVWFRTHIKDDALADEALHIESQHDFSAQASRARIRAAIERRYTLPANPPLPMPGTDAAPTREQADPRRDVRPM